MSLVLHLYFPPLHMFGRKDVLEDRVFQVCLAECVP